MVYSVYMTVIFTVLGVFVSICAHIPSLKRAEGPGRHLIYPDVYAVFQRRANSEYLLMKSLGLLTECGYCPAGDVSPGNADHEKLSNRDHPG